MSKIKYYSDVEFLDNKISVKTIKISDKSTIDSSSGQVSTAGTSVEVDSFSKLTERTAKYIFQISSADGQYQSGEFLILHDDTNVYITEYALVYTGNLLASINASIDGDLVRVFFVSSENNLIIKLSKNTISI